MLTKTTQVAVYINNVITAVIMNNSDKTEYNKYQDKEQGRPEETCRLHRQVRRRRQTLINEMTNSFLQLGKN